MATFAQLIDEIETYGLETVVKVTIRDESGSHLIEGATGLVGETTKLGQRYLTVRSTNGWTKSVVAHRCHEIDTRPVALASLTTDALVVILEYLKEAAKEVTKEAQTHWLKGSAPPPIGLAQG